MTAFITFAALLAVIAVLFVILPLVGRRNSTPPSAIAAMIVTLGLVGASAIVYSALGNPSGIRLTAAASGGGEQVAQLARAAQRSPNDVGAWLRLGEAYAENGQYTLALHAYGKANELADGRNAFAVAGIGEAMLLGGDGSDSAQSEAAPYFERALQLDPHSPKGLFYSALIAYRTGRLAIARERFATMLTLTPPPPQNVRVALRKEITEIDAQLHPRIDAATAIHLRVSLAPGLVAKVPPNASLFVFVRGAAGGPPLAVKRLNARQLPQEIELSADDAMIASNTVHPGERVTVVARISTSGSPLAQKGDLYGEIQYVAGKTGPRALTIDKQSP